MRIIAGAWRGRPLDAPPGRGTRPTSDRAREGLFSMLQSRLGSFEDLEVADLFAGTGALGLEALSRGAAHCTFVEKDRGALDILRRNFDRLGAGDRADLRAQSAEHAAPPRRPCDLVFMDPPYAQGLVPLALEQLVTGQWLSPNALVVAETGSDEPALEAPGWTILDERTYGAARVYFLRRR